MSGHLWTDLFQAWYYARQLNSTVLFQFYSSLNELDVHTSSQGHVKAITCAVILLKLHDVTQMVVIIAYVREMTVKKSCKYGEYGSFEHLLFLFSILCLIWRLSLWENRTEWHGENSDSLLASLSLVTCLPKRLLHTFHQFPCRRRREPAEIHTRIVRMTNSPSLSDGLLSCTNAEIRRAVRVHVVAVLGAQPHESLVRRFNLLSSTLPLRASC